MSWLSAAWQRNKGAIASVASLGVSTIPFIGGAIANKVGTQIAGSAFTNPGQAEIDAQAALNARQIEDARMNAANMAAKLGTAATLGAAGAIGPPGNIYQTAGALGADPRTLVVLGAVVLLALFLILRRR